MTQSNNAITVTQVSKRFGRLQALDRVSFEIPADSVFCILGPNGAGKTTLIRILTTVTRPDSGSVVIESMDSQKDLIGLRKVLGVVSQENRFDRYFSVWHNLSLHAELHGLTKATYEPLIQSLLEKVHLFDRRKALPEDLSGGQQRRIALVRAMIHSPKVLFLDEPTTGLDPQARLEIWHTIETLKQDTTVVLTTHYLEEADRLSDNLLMLNNGQVVAAGTGRELKEKLSPRNQYQIDLSQPLAQVLADRINTIFNPPNALLAGIHINSPFQLIADLNDPALLYTMLSHIPSEHLQSFGKLEANLEDVFFAIATQKTLPTPEKGVN